MIKNGEILNEVFRLYSERKRNAEHLAFEINQRVMQNEEYSNLCYAIRNLNLDIAKAEYECQYSLSEHSFKAICNFAIKSAAPCP